MSNEFVFVMRPMVFLVFLRRQLRWDRKRNEHRCGGDATSVIWISRSSPSLFRFRSPAWADAVFVRAAAYGEAAGDSGDV